MAWELSLIFLPSLDSCQDSLSSLGQPRSSGTGRGQTKDSACEECLCLCDWSLYIRWASNWRDSIALLTGIQGPRLELLRGCGGKSHEAVTGSVGQTCLGIDAQIHSQSSRPQLWIQSRQGQRGSDSTQTSLSGRIKDRSYAPIIYLFILKSKSRPAIFTLRLMASPKALDSILNFSGTLQFSEHRSEHGYSITHVFSVLTPVRHTRGYHQTSIMLQIRKLRYQREISPKSTQIQSVDCWSEPLTVSCCSFLFDRSQSWHYSWMPVHRLHLGVWESVHN